MEHAASEVSEAYSDVFEEEMPDQSADDEASDAASIRSGLTLSHSPHNLPGEDSQEEEAYIRGKWLNIRIRFVLYFICEKQTLIIASLMQVQLRLNVLYPCLQVQTLLASLAAYAVLASGNPSKSLVCQKCEGQISVPLLHKCFHGAA